MEFAKRMFGGGRKNGGSSVGNGVVGVCGETSTKTNSVNKYATTAASPSSAPPPVNVKCRNGLYPNSESVNRFTVPDSAVPWDSELPNYTPGMTGTKLGILNDARNRGG